MWPCKVYLICNHIFWWTNEGYSHKNHNQVSRHWINFYVIFGSNKYLDGQKTNIKLPDGNNINNRITGKTKPS